MVSIVGHFRTITEHKINVMKTCFKVGLYKQGLLHDNSKYYPTEFIRGCMFYQGDKSPNVEERNQIGYSAAWMHHKGRNKHHFEYWIDYGSGNSDEGDKGLLGIKMPLKYVVEMFVDRVCATKNYQKEKYTDEGALIYYNNSKDRCLLHEDTRALLEYMLEMLAKKGEKETFSYIKHEILKEKVPYKKSELEILKNAL